MANEFFFRRLDLQLFAEGSGGAASGGTAGADGATGVSGVAAVPQTKGVKSNPLANVVYGKQDDAQTADVQTTTEANAVETPDRNAEFEKLIKGEYKDLYDQRVQDTIQKRLKGSKETVDKYNALTPTLELLAKKYGVDSADIEALNKAIEEDDAYYEEEALEKGITVEQLKEIKKVQRENAELKRQMEEKHAKEKQEEIYATWMEQADKAKMTYPSLDIRAEIKNPDFASLLKAGIDVKTAYEVVHKDEIIPAAMQYTAKAVEQKLTNKIMANGARPAENGTSSQSATVVKSDVSQLSKADRAEIIRRVQRGEIIKF
jgi:hypothetical protein